MSNIKFFKEENLALEMHKVRIVQKLNLLPIDERLVVTNLEALKTLVIIHSYLKIEKYT